MGDLTDLPRDRSRSAFGSFALRDSTETEGTLLCPCEIRGVSEKKSFFGIRCQTNGGIISWNPWIVLWLGLFSSLKQDIWMKINYESYLSAERSWLIIIPQVERRRNNMLQTAIRIHPV